MNYFTDVLKKYAVFNGRASRKEYWMFFLIYVIIYVLLYAIGRAMGVTILQLLYSLALLIPNLAVATRRLHDTNRSGWWILIGLIPLVGLVLIVFLAMEGDYGENKYGQDTKESASV